MKRGSLTSSLAQCTFQFLFKIDEKKSEREERRVEIESVVRSLPAAYRELIILRHSQDLTYEEIVAVTGLPLGTVKNRLFRAREMMRQLFIDRGIGSV